ncbi:hypothetical protein [Burkholderia cenocepacia]|uniref:hypothetical protein n=1 Tax=Burkholderia cenocepacia TaxID=95486 RepID=UPI002B24CDD6|nr:hypothetical protein [Burkholderia cenocepacia]MEB2498629.1 hypothetical protein [Burkholderia cenocepacia]MEB2556437.1 hypothetical protein [Burkholderia cenocepacia]
MAILDRRSYTGANRPHRCLMCDKKSKSETFAWKSVVYDVSAILAAIDRGELSPRMTYIGKPLIDWYCVEMVRFDDDPPQSDGRDRVTLSRNHVDTVACRGVMDRPIILADVGPDSSGFTDVLNDGEWHGTYVVIDGNHRLAYAYLHEVPRLPAYQIEREDLTRFILSIDGFDSPS